eukprot:4657992-Amphidinium_carterae.2
MFRDKQTPSRHEPLGKSLTARHGRKHRLSDLSHSNGCTTISGQRKAMRSSSGSISSRENDALQKCPRFSRQEEKLKTAMLYGET